MGFTLQQMRARRIADSRAEARERILALYPVEIQLSALHGLYNNRPIEDPKNPITMKATIQAILDRQNAMTAEILASTDLDGIDSMRFDQ